MLHSRLTDDALATTPSSKKELSGGPSLLQQVESQLLREFAAVASPSPVEDFKVQNPPRLLTHCDAPKPQNILAGQMTIEFKADYYKILGVIEKASQNAIYQGFASNWRKFSPDSDKGKLKWISNNPNQRKRAASKWFATSKAYKILSTPSLRARYDDGRYATTQKDGGISGIPLSNRNELRKE